MRAIRSFLMMRRKRLILGKIAGLKHWPFPLWPSNIPRMWMRTAIAIPSVNLPQSDGLWWDHKWYRCSANQKLSLPFRLMTKSIPRECHRLRRSRLSIFHQACLLPWNTKAQYAAQHHLPNVAKLIR
jgi:hypothetical protein